ncbi:NADPH-dependent ferric siderophore reductase [Actinoplanes lutulentus]|uniref:NADPH-dependent ferric siderophore reductase n=2 Tax=Actinoplanes lutulentus TaxID=1287878 RepID=A0A327ZBR6_9ACTN|nr:NADPH-dependent ferric siderophore reductase [Actinoplanes lutulentus]
MRTTVTFPIVLRELTVLRVADINDGTRRVTIGGPQLGAFHRDGLDLPALRSEGFDDHVKLFFAAPGADEPVLPRQAIASLDWPADARPIAKDYTPHRVTASEVDLDFVRHGTGPAASWAESAAAGDTIWMAGPKMSQSHPAGADWIVAAGDETALPALRRWLREMPAGSRARVFVEVTDMDRWQELPTAADAEVTWVNGSVMTLAEAVMSMPWPDGKVFAWVAGEAGAIRPLRRYLRVERGLPAEQVEITGYWKRTGASSFSAAVSPEAVSPAEASSDGAAFVGAAGLVGEDDAHERLHELAEITPGLAIRVAVTLGIVDLVDRGTNTLAALAGATGVEAGSLELLMNYLTGLDVFTVSDGGGYGLSEVGEELLDDGDEYHLEGPASVLEFALLGLAGRAVAGQSLGSLFEREPGLGGPARVAVEDAAIWMVPKLITAYDWSSATAIVAAGHAAGSALNALGREFPHLALTAAALPSALAVLRSQVLDADIAERAELVATSGAIPVRAGATHLLVRLLDWLSDEDAGHLLTEFAQGLPPGADVVVVEEYRPAADDDELEDIEQDLLMRAAFGSGRRSVARLGELLDASGLRVLSSVDIGWSHRVWHATPA